jgi:hypothetical protein
VRRGCKRGCGVNVAQRWPRVGVSGVGLNDQGLEVKAKAQRLRS